MNVLDAVLGAGVVTCYLTWRRITHAALDCVPQYPVLGPLVQTLWMFDFCPLPGSVLIMLEVAVVLGGANFRRGQPLWFLNCRRASAFAPFFKKLWEYNPSFTSWRIACGNLVSLTNLGLSFHSSLGLSWKSALLLPKSFLKCFKRASSPSVTLPCFIDAPVQDRDWNKPVVIGHFSHEGRPFRISTWCMLCSTSCRAEREKELA